MCRWFAYISPSEPCLLEDVLVLPKHALTKQIGSDEHYLPKLVSHLPGEENTPTEIKARDRMHNIDGFGVAWWTSTRQAYTNDTSGPRPVVYRHDQPPHNDANFHSICENTSTLVLMSHVRAATATAVNRVNSHPFTFGRHVIMHNGVVADFMDIKRDLLPLLSKDAFANIKGSTDSEHLGALYITELTKKDQGSQAGWNKSYSTAELKAALITTFETLINLQKKILGTKAEASSLNVCVSDGSKMVAFRFRNHIVEQPPSLYFSTSAGVTLNRKYPDSAEGHDNPHASKPKEHHGPHVIISSEPTTYNAKQWQLIEKNHAVLVDQDGTMKHEKIEIAGDGFMDGKSLGPG